MRYTTESFETFPDESLMWPDLLRDVRPEMRYIARSGILAVMNSLGLTSYAARAELAGKPLFVNSDDNLPVLNREVVGFKVLSPKRRDWLSAGASTLLLAQAVSRMLEHPDTNDVVRDNSDYAVMKKLVVDPSKTEQAALDFPRAAGVKSFSVRWYPGRDGVVNNVQVNAELEDDLVDYRSVMVRTAHKFNGQFITFEGGEVTNGFPTEVTLVPQNVQKMGQGLLIAAEVS